MPVVLEQEGLLYTYTGVGLSALLVSTYRAMRRPLDRGTSDRQAPVFYVYGNTVINMLHWSREVS